MSVDVTPETRDLHRAALERRLATGVPLPPAPDGPVVAYFHSMELANALEHCANQTAAGGLTKVTMHMTIPNALDLAAYLRRAVLAGV